MLGGRETVMVHYTVLIPARDATDAVARLIAQVRVALDRLILPYEILCVDDASTPRQAAALEALLSDQPSLRLLRFDQARGTSAALSAGIAAARGELVIGMQPDSPLSPDCLPHLISRLARHDLAIAEAELTLGEILRGWLKNMPRLLSAIAARDEAAALFFAARRDAMTGLALVPGAFRILPALAIKRGLKVCRMSVAAGMPPRGENYRAGLVQRLIAGWLDRRFEPHLARELAPAAGPRSQPAIMRGDVARPRFAPQIPAVPAQQQGKPA